MPKIFFTKKDLLMIIVVQILIHSTRAQVDDGFLLSGLEEGYTHPLEDTLLNSPKNHKNDRNSNKKHSKSTKKSHN